jgi:hypothetical protein
MGGDESARTAMPCLVVVNVAPGCVTIDSWGPLLGAWVGRAVGVIVTVGGVGATAGATTVTPGRGGADETDVLVEFTVCVVVRITVRVWAGGVSVWVTGKKTVAVAVTVTVTVGVGTSVATAAGAAEPAAVPPPASIAHASSKHVEIAPPNINRHDLDAARPSTPLSTQGSRDRLGGQLRAAEIRADRARTPDGPA